MAVILKSVRYVTTDHHARIEHRVKKGVHHETIVCLTKTGHHATSDATPGTNETTEIEETTASTQIVTGIGTEIADLTTTTARRRTTIEVVPMAVTRTGLIEIIAGQGVRAHWTVIGVKGREIEMRETGISTVGE